MCDKMLSDPSSKSLALIAQFGERVGYRRGVRATDQIQIEEIFEGRAAEMVFRDRGTLNVGTPADVALLELRDGNFEFLDNYGNKADRPCRQADYASLALG